MDPIVQKLQICKYKEKTDEKTMRCERESKKNQAFEKGETDQSHRVN